MVFGKMNFLFATVVLIASSVVASPINIVAKTKEVIHVLRHFEKLNLNDNANNDFFRQSILSS
mgnify:CR=1 FL=1